MHELGTALLHLAFTTTLATALLCLVGAATRSTRLLDAGRHAMIGSWLLYLAMSAALMYSLVTHDFSNKYIAAYTDSDMPFAYILAGFWGGEKGALLFWTAVLSTFSVISITRNRTQPAVFLGWASGVLHSAILFFAALMVYESNPFEVFQSFAGPADGKGMNPLLQNPFMSIHPPAMLTGYMTFTVPFAFGVAALITGKLDSQWIRDTRQWTLVSWMFLTIGLILGGAWAYQELGWGGFWMWDPVENAGLIPWFTATAYLHSVMIQERRNMLRRWNAVLVCLTFLLTIFGTFLTRSQLIDSVHAFADSTLAPWFLWYMAAIAVLSIVLVSLRWKQLRADAHLDSMMSREAFFVLNNVLLVGCAFVVMWGTLFAKISEAEAFQELYNSFAGALTAIGIPADPMHQAVELGEPWFNRVMAPLGLSLLLLTGIGPLISWRRATRKNFERNFRRPVSWGSLVTAIVVVAWSLRSLWRAADAANVGVGEVFGPWLDALGRTEIYGVLAVWFGIFVFITLSIEFHIGASARRRARGEPYWLALTMLTLRSKRRYGGYIVHLGIVFCFLAFTGNAFRIYQPEVSLNPGDRTQVGQYGLLYTGSNTSYEADGAYVHERATVVSMERDERIDEAVVQAVLHDARTFAGSAVTAGVEPGSPRIALDFVDDSKARAYAGRRFAAELGARVDVLADSDSRTLAMQPNMGLQQVARVAPRMVMGLFKDVREFFEASPLPGVVATTPGQMRFTVRFDKAADRATFAEWMKLEVAADTLMIRYNSKLRPTIAGKKGGRVDVVPAGVGSVLYPEVRFYAKHSSPTTEVAIKSTFEHDLYLAMRPQQGQRFITLLAIVFPFVSFLWLGAAVMVFGATICMWPVRQAATQVAQEPVRVPAKQLGPTIVGLLLLVCGLGFARESRAEVTPDELGFSVVTSAQFRRGTPMIVFEPSVSVKALALACKRSDGKSFAFKTRAIRSGATTKLPIKNGKGIFTYACTLSGKAGKDKIGPFVLDPFEVKVGEPPRFSLTESDVNEAARTITVRVSETKGRIELKVFDDNGESIDEVETAYDVKPGTPITVRWKQAKGTVMGHFELKVYDQVGYYSGVESITFVNIPHDDIIFESGKWEITKAEQPKLHEPLGKIQAALAKVRGILPIKLFVAGYTDTVGSAADNLVLSRKRAMSIAKWFAQHGIKAPILYQGFGEAALFVQTPDNTAQKSNRRAVYVLSKDLPPASRGFPSRSWSPLR